MKKIFSFLTIPTLLFSGCSAEDVLSEVEIKELATCQLDGVNEEDLDSCQLLKDDSGKHFYRVKEKLHDEIFYEIDIDAKSGNVLQVESETSDVGTLDVGKDFIKNKIFELLPGCKDFNIFSLQHVYDDEETYQPYYEAKVILNDKAYELIYDAKSGEKLYQQEYDFGEVIEQKEKADEPGNTPYFMENRPIWIQGHRCNTNYSTEYKGSGVELLPERKRKVANALNHGCNGVEIDLRHRACDDTIRLCHDNSITIYHSESLRDFLSLPEMRDPRMTLVVYDIKEPEYIQDILDITHEFIDNNAFAPLDSEGNIIEGGNHTVNFIYSCSSLYGMFGKDNSAHRYFPMIVDQLRPNEGLCVDFENDYDAVNDFFNEIECPRSWYGNGIFSGLYGSGTINGCKNAVRIRDTKESPYDFKGVESWTCHRKGDLVTRLNWGIDSAMVDRPQSGGDFVTKAISEINGGHLASRDDSPF